VALLCHIERSAAALYNTVIQTNYGPVQGVKAFNSTPNGNLSNWEDITVWKGIPYGADTSGANRWRPPQPAIPWNTTFQASSYGDTCPPTTGDMGSSVVASEDCLNLNIWSAASNASEKRPVIFWSCPAGGSAAQALFDGAGMADQGIVFVNYKYVLNIAIPQFSTAKLYSSAPQSKISYKT
jgi:carboxylesterase 2